MGMKDRQIFFFKLLNHILEPVAYKDIIDIGTNFKIEDSVELYTVSITRQNIFVIQLHT